MEKTRVCAKCGKELTEEKFSKGKNQCKDCLYDYQKQWKLENKEAVSKRDAKYRSDNRAAINQRGNQYYQDNKEIIAKKIKQWQLDNKEIVQERGRKYYQANKEKVTKRNDEYRQNDRESYLERNRKYYLANRESIAIKESKWRKENKDKVNTWTNQRRALRRGLPSTLTAIQWEAIKQHFNNTCCYCGEEKPLDQEHFVPLSEGGEYTRDNIIPACRCCNSSKSNKPFGIWYPRYHHYSKKREETILKFLNYGKQNIQQLSISL